MKKIYFQNSKKWKLINADIYAADGNVCKSVSLGESGDSLELSLDLDQSDNHIVFYNGNERTSKVYPGALSIGVDYRYNEKMGRDLTYLCSSASIKSGRVDNYTIIDEKNLSYREDKSKKISVFVPESYDGITPHDILYFFDGQNLFGNAGEYTENGDPYGSWQIDIVLSELHRQYGKNIIVVGIDNADMYRSNELFMDPKWFGKLSPLAFAIPEDDFSFGYLRRLSSFMVSTLHNFIKQKYCVNTNNVGIGGSSMGGIASFFCSIFELGFYKYVLSYSPAFGLYEMGAFDEWFKKIDFRKYLDLLPKIHIYCGGGDMLEEQLLPSSKEMKALLIKRGYEGTKIFETYDMEKPHNEESWRLVLPESFSCLFGLKV